MVLAIAVGIGVTLKKALVPMIALPTAFGIMILLRRSVKDRIQDERLIRLAEKSARSSLSVYALAATLIGEFLMAFNRSTREMYAAGFALLLSAAFLMVFYVLLYILFTRQD